MTAASNLPISKSALPSALCASAKSGLILKTRSSTEMWKVALSAFETTNGIASSARDINGSTTELESPHFFCLSDRNEELRPDGHYNERGLESARRGNRYAMV